MTPAPHGASCAGFPFAPGVFRGLFVICLICHFNAPVRHFNSGRCAYIAAAPRALCALFMALWRGIAPRRAFPLCGVLPACRHRAPPLALGGVAGPCGAGADWFGLSAWSLHAGRGFWWGRGAPPKSLILPQNHSRLQDSVYKRRISLAYFPGIGGKSFKSRSISAHFASKSLASMYFCWSCSGDKPSICGWFGVNTISCLSTMP